jgi:hypothetical protein
MQIMKKFYITHNTDNDNKFAAALLQAGFIEVAKMAEAEFIVHDGIRREVVFGVGNRPAFIIPHTPQSWFLWDGLCAVTPVRCNFVAGQAGVDGMKSYGYPYRVEAVGFSRCAVREFTPSRGRNLLFVPSHAIEGGGYAENNYVEKVMRVFDFIVRNRHSFAKITMCWDAQNESRLSDKLRRCKINFIPTNPHKDKTPLLAMMERIEAADLVISCGTVGCVSVAMGKPTVFFSEIGVPHTPPNQAALHSERYLGRSRHPCMAEKMTIEEIMAVRVSESEDARRWRLDNIGGSFNAEKFIKIVKEELENVHPISVKVMPACRYCSSLTTKLVRNMKNVSYWQCVKCKRTFTSRMR